MSELGGEFKGLEPIQDAPVSTTTGIAAIALNMALKYHDTTMIKDGAMYQQYKLEGRNIRGLNLDMVFETAIQIETHLLGASDRIAGLVVDALTAGVAGESDENPESDVTPTLSDLKTGEL
jgi:hypothetical protein